jgi:hypothetical protein
MDFRATNFGVTMLLLVAFTIFIVGVRSKKPLENNWPLLYWILLVVVVTVRLEDTFSMPMVLLGLACGLALRCEFMNGAVARLLRTVELCVWAYIVYCGFDHALL